MIRLAWYKHEAVRVLVEWLHELRRAHACEAGTTDCAAVQGAVSSRGGPMLFEFTEPERNTMRRALELYVSELSGEIVKTEKREWLQALREEKTILKGVIEQLSV